jgi:hypothetical protein
LKFVRNAIAALALLIASVTSVAAGEWREGDEVFVRIASPSQELVIEIAETYERDGVDAGNARTGAEIEKGNVFYSPIFVPGVLVVKIAGPYQVGTDAASVWAVQFGENTVLYILLDDSTGDHEPDQQS